MNVAAGVWATAGAAIGLALGVGVNRFRKARGVNVPLVGAALGALGALAITDRKKGTAST